MTSAVIVFVHFFYRFHCFGCHPKRKLDFFLSSIIFSFLAVTPATAPMIFLAKWGFSRFTAPNVTPILSKQPQFVLISKMPKTLVRSALPSAVMRVEGRLRPRLFHLLDFRPLSSVEILQFFQHFLAVHFLLKVCQLLLVTVLHRLLNRANGIEQGAVMLLSFLRDDGGRFGSDELLCDQSVDILFHRVLAQSHRVTYSLVARVALKGFPVLAEHQVSVYRDLACREIQTKDFVRQRKIIFHRIALWISVVLHTASPQSFSFLLHFEKWLSTHSRNFSLGTIKRLPTRMTGNPFSCISS